MAAAGPLFARAHREYAVDVWPAIARRSHAAADPDWSAFFPAELGALAALTGFVVVAISINLARILAYPGLPSRAAEALIGPMGAITATGVVLVPETPPALGGALILATGGLMVVAPIAIQARTWRLRKDATAFERTIRVATSAGVGLAFVVGGALLTLGDRVGLYWLAAGDIASLVAVVLSSWVLMIEILR